MKNYIFSLFTRFFIAFTGFLIFIVSARIYGSEGRGLIAYGNTQISIFATIFSLSTGRMFLIETAKNNNLKEKLLSSYIFFNIILIFLSIFSAFLYWHLLPPPEEIINEHDFIYFLTITPYYLWSINGTVIFAVMNQTHLQEKIILYTRTLLIIALIFLLYTPPEINNFIFTTNSILGGSALFEMLILTKPVKTHITYKEITKLVTQIKKTIWPHLDYIAFNTFPLILLLITGFYLSLPEVGRLNFTIQLVNFIFLISVVASIRIKTYVSSDGSLFHLDKIKKLLAITIGLSLTSSLIVFLTLQSNTFYLFFPDFNNLHTSFLVSFFIILITSRANAVMSGGVVVSSMM